MLPSGKRLQTTMENHQIFDGDLSFTTGHGFHSKLLVYQRVDWRVSFPWQAQERAAEAERLRQQEAAGAGL